MLNYAANREISLKDVETEVEACVVKDPYGPKECAAKIVVGMRTIAGLNEMLVSDEDVFYVLPKTSDPCLAALPTIFTVICKVYGTLHTNLCAARGTLQHNS